MPGFILHQGAMVICSHNGNASPTTSSNRVFLNGMPITLQPMPYAVTGCPFTLPSGTNMPCITGIWLSASMRITSMGMPVLLTDSLSVCTPNGTPLNILNTQTRVKGI